jgi:predicted TIM-barrel fold metal-dependent hydrolase
MMKDLFEDGYVDKAILQSTYLKQWYRTGFNTVEKNGALAEKHPDRFIVNGRWDPRDGQAGLEVLAHDAQRWNLRGVKLYTAEWQGDSRGWKLTDPEAYEYLAQCEALGINNIHVHKGPTILAVGQGCVRRRGRRSRGDGLPELELHRGARGVAAHRTSASWRLRNRTCMRDSPWCWAV